MFDLIEYANRHRYRVRNLHDGRPLHPLRVPVGGRGKSDGYVGLDRMDVIIGQHGYVCDEGGGRIGWYVFAKSRQGLNQWTPKLKAAGAEIKQDCDWEMAGDAPVESVDAVLAVIKPFKRASRPYMKARMPALQASLSARIDANTSEGS